MDYSPIWISLKTASVSIVITFFLGILVAKWVVNIRHEKLKMILDGIRTLPMVLPPTVVGLLLITSFWRQTSGRNVLFGILWLQDRLLMVSYGNRRSGDLLPADAPAASARRLRTGGSKPDLCGAYLRYA